MILFVVLGILSAAVYGGLTWESFNAPSVPRFIALYSVAFLLFIFSVCFIQKNSLSAKRSTFLTIILFAIVFRLIMLGGEPLFEDDMHRYLWDGKVSSHGINPYFYPPDDYQLKHLRDENWKQINYKNVSTIYPPLAQTIFYSAWQIAPNNAIALKYIFFIFDLGVFIGLVYILRSLKLSNSNVILYAWNPLVIKEFANSGHLDVAAIFFVVLFCLFLLKEWKSCSAIALGLAILVKVYPLVFLPALTRCYRGKHFLILGVVLVLGYIPFLSAQELLFDGLWIYAQHWEFNDSGYVLLTGFLKLFTNSFHLIAKGMIVLGLACWGWRRSQNFDQMQGIGKLKIFFSLLGAMLIFSPTVDTWYITWIIPFLCFFPSKSWLLLTGTCVLAYAYYWKNQDFWWIRTLEYLPFYVFLIKEVFYAKGERDVKTSQKVQIA